MQTYRSYMFRSMNIIRKFALNLAKFLFMLKHSVKLRRYMLFGDVASCHRAACLLCAVQQKTHLPLSDMLPHHQIKYNDVILPTVLT